MLDKLTKQQVERLVHAFNNGQTDYIVLPDNKFVGVNCGDLPNLTVTQEKNGWVSGYVSVVPEDQVKTQ